ncbi:hypothetical protein D3C80_1783600 [compost metagenome]
MNLAMPITIGVANLSLIALFVVKMLHHVFLHKFQRFFHLLDLKLPWFFGAKHDQKALHPLKQFHVLLVDQVNAERVLVLPHHQ